MTAAERRCAVCGRALAADAPLPASWLMHTTGRNLPGRRLAFTCSDLCREMSDGLPRYQANEAALARQRALDAAERERKTWGVWPAESANPAQETSAMRLQKQREQPRRCADCKRETVPLAKALPGGWTLRVNDSGKLVEVCPACDAAQKARKAAATPAPAPQTAAVPTPATPPPAEHGAGWPPGCEPIEDPESLPDEELFARVAARQRALIAAGWPRQKPPEPEPEPAASAPLSAGGWPPPNMTETPDRPPQWDDEWPPDLQQERPPRKALVQAVRPPPPRRRSRGAP